MIRNIVIPIILTITFLQTKADYQTPGTGISRNLVSLVLHSAGILTLESVIYYLCKNLRINTNDV